MSTPAPSWQAVLEFWFSLDRPGKKDDPAVRAELGPLILPAREGALDPWSAEPHSRLALVLLLDQVPRHVFRDRPQQYHGDPKAQEVAGQFLRLRDWETFTPLQRYYGIVPWVHAERVELQDAVNPIVHRLAAEDAALRVSARISDLYRDTIARFGRFPHRNALLGRDTTPAEETFLNGEWRARKREAHREA